MYQIVKNMIAHTWSQTNTTTEEQLIYYICGVIIVILTVVVVDLVYRVFSNFWKGKR